MIAQSLLQSFLLKGWGAGFVGFVKEERWLGDHEVLRRLQLVDEAARPGFWFDLRKGTKENSAKLEKVIAHVKPNLVYCFGHEAVALANQVQGDFFKIAAIYDPLHFNSAYKVLNSLRHPRLRVVYHAIRRLPSIYRNWRRHRLEELPALAGADLVIVHSYSHSRFYAKYLSGRVCYFPNPLTPAERIVRKETLVPPSFIMAGALHSSVTWTGLDFFLREVLRYIAEDLETDKYQIRILGGGPLRPELEKLRSVRNIHFLGQVSHNQLLEEYGRAYALLVPTPIRLGFRTRIMDAFRFGVPVIAHSANQAGFKELDHGHNCLLATDGVGFATSMRRAISDRNYIEKISDNARSEFLSRYSSEIFADYVCSHYQQWGLKNART